MNINTKKGFTLIELLLVVSIISLLTSVITASASETKEQTKDTHRKAEVHEVRTAIELSRDKGVPSNYNCLGTTCTIVYSPEIAREGTNSYNASMQELVDKGAYPEIPNSPDGESYFYVNLEGHGGTAIFGSLLRSMKEQIKNGGCEISDPDFECVLAEGESEIIINKKTSGGGSIQVYPQDSGSENSLIASCGSDAGDTFTHLTQHGPGGSVEVTIETPGADLCDQGEVGEPVALVDYMYTWTCVPTSGGDPISCEAYYVESIADYEEEQEEPIPQPPDDEGQEMGINGICGDAVNNSYSEFVGPTSETPDLCSSGQLAGEPEMNSVEAKWEWVCGPIGFGFASQCQASIYMD